MKIKLDLDRRDLLTIVVLSTVFFSLAIWNLGLSQVPVNGWRTTENESFYIDLGEQRSIGTVYFLVKNGSADVQVDVGSPESWNENRSLSIQASYYTWKELEVNWVFAR
jgi:hypothetical protein